MLHLHPAGAPVQGASLASASGARYHRPPFATSAAAAVTRQLPPEWGSHVAAAREEIAWTLQTLNPNALELTKVWFDSGYAAARLIDVTSAEFAGRLPAQVGWVGWVGGWVRGPLWS